MLSPPRPRPSAPSPDVALHFMERKLAMATRLTHSISSLLQSIMSLKTSRKHSLHKIHQSRLKSKT
jgi:hypothetical protein